MVTGATGYIASWIVKEFLAQGACGSVLIWVRSLLAPDDAHHHRLIDQSTTHAPRTPTPTGYRVRATVRDPSNAKKLAFLKALPGAEGRLSFHKADLLVPGSFDEVIQGAFV